MKLFISSSSIVVVIMIGICCNSEPFLPCCALSIRLICDQLRCSVCLHPLHIITQTQHQPEAVCVFVTIFPSLPFVTLCTILVLGLLFFYYYFLLFAAHYFHHLWIFLLNFFCGFHLFFRRSFYPLLLVFSLSFFTRSSCYPYIQILRISRSLFIFLVCLHLGLLLHPSPAPPDLHRGSVKWTSQALYTSRSRLSFLPSFISVSIPSFAAPWGRQ